MSDMQSAVLDAADALVGAFGRHDREAYFAAFTPEATFLFHNLDRTLGSRAAYEAEWTLWEERDGFRVLACRSRDRRVHLLGDVAIFTHVVETELSVCGERVTNNERETIVFSRDAAGCWLAVHEHLSAIPSNLP
ncbi:YybH family protein [Sinorhizobium psoraleae]|uniref:Nuclear transport factor 2 family protein n=1 Tax=Sinorhizobium psoraleae TaxID=520838 RepID=A0ABT4K9L4_9HYPH|nr:nuclear transport factor 2 family protein [Sinorhizobium psoraleae]MCZ4088630.1 nuclear transport factor 2 family protein [Sinorhizobium psoraleae]